MIAVASFPLSASKPAWAATLSCAMAAARLLNLGLRLGSRLGDRRGTCLQRQLTARFLTLEYGHTRFPQPLLIFRCARFGLGDVGLRLLDRAFGSAVPLRQHLYQRLVHDRGVNAEQQHDKDDSWNGPEQ